MKTREELELEIQGWERNANDTSIAEHNRAAFAQGAAQANAELVQLDGMANDTAMSCQQALALRQRVLDLNQLGVRYGYEDMAGTPDDPDSEYVKRFEAGETPAQVIATDFGA